jgi:hypothetical protein
VRSNVAGNCRHTGAMATKRKTRKLDKAKSIIRAMTTRGATRAKLLQATVGRAGISTRTYRTARKQLRTIAVRRSAKHRGRGTGRWYAKGR